MSLHEEPGSVLEKQSEKQGVIQRISAIADNVVRRPSYELFQKVATYGSVFGEPAYRLTCALTNTPPDETIIQATRYMFAGAFGTNLGTKVAAKGVSHMKSAEGLIDITSIASEVTPLPVGPTRLARLFRQVRSVAKSVRTLRSTVGTYAIEDQTVAELQNDWTWGMMTLLAAMPLVADFRNEENADPSHYIGNILFSSLIVGLAKWQRRKTRQRVHNNYTRILERERQEVERMIQENPPLAFLRDELTKGDRNEITGLTKPYMQVLVELAEMINPIGEDLTLDTEGNIETKELDAGVMVTDMRNFTRLTEQLGDEIFPMLRMTYFPILRAIILKHKGKVLNHTGDGLVMYFTDHSDMSKEERMARCALEMNKITNTMADLFIEHGCGTKDASHRTGIGMATGPLRIGDILRISKSDKGTHIDLKKLHDAIFALVQESVNVDMESTANKPGRIAGMGRSINLAARIESQDKNFPDHSCLMSPECFQALPEDLQKEFEPLEPVSLKGFAEPVTMYGKRMQGFE